MKLLCVEIEGSQETPVRTYLDLFPAASTLGVLK